MNEFHTLRSLVGGLSERGDQTVVLSLQKEDAERWSYAELADHARRLACGLAGAGISPGDHVALLAPNSPRWVLACLAVVEAGAVVMPLDVQLDDEMLAHALSDSGTKLAFTTSEYVGKFEDLDREDGPRLVLLDVDEDDERGWRRLLADEPGEGPEVGPDDPAALFYTSGTTGTAKGVPLSHRNLAFQLNAIPEAGVVRADDRVLLPLPLHHVYPFVIGALTPLALGLTIIFPYALTGPQITRAINEGEASLIVGVPRLYSALYQAIQQQAGSGGRVAAKLFEAGLSASAWLRRKLGLSAGKLLLRPLHQRFGPQLRVVASGGSALDPELAGQLESLGWRIAQGYGLTETSPLLTLKAPDGKKIDSVGRPVPGVELCLDPSAVPGEDGEEPGGNGEESRTSEANRIGEILARGPGVFSGYRNMPEKTEEAFTEDGWYRTEDMGYLDEDGYLHVTGRVSTLIVTEGGKNVQPEDVEDAYLKSPVIEEIGVLQKDGKLVAVIVPDPNGVKQSGGEAGEAVREAVNECSRDLPSYRRLSDYAVSQEPLQYTRLGKLRRHTLEERYEKVKSGEDQKEAGPIPIEEMSREDQNLLEDPAARRAWDWLADRYGDQRLTPETSLQLDLGVDSMEWVNLTFEMGQSVGVELDEEAIGRVASVRDLLTEVAEASEAGGGTNLSPVEQPEEVLSEEQQRFLRPLSPVEGVAARALYALNRALARGVFGLSVEGLENVPKEGPFIIAPNHLSYLDAFAIGAALDFARVRSTYWAAYAGVAYGNPINSAVSRLARAMPIDDEKAVFSSLAFGAAALKEGNGLVWFPEGQRSPDGELQRFERGVGLLLDHYRVPVVPVAIGGTREAMPPGKALPRPRKVTVVFGEPLDPDDLEERGEGDDPGERILHALRDRVAKLLARP